MGGKLPFSAIFLLVGFLPTLSWNWVPERVQLYSNTRQLFCALDQQVDSRTCTFAAFFGCWIEEETQLCTNWIGKQKAYIRVSEMMYTARSRAFESGGIQFRLCYLPSKQTTEMHSSRGRRGFSCGREHDHTDNCMWGVFVLGNPRKSPTVNKVRQWRLIKIY